VTDLCDDAGLLLCSVRQKSDNTNQSHTSKTYFAQKGCIFSGATRSIGYGKDKATGKLIKG